MSAMKITVISGNVSGVMFYRIKQPVDAWRRYFGVQAKLLWYGDEIYEPHPWEVDLMKDEHRDFILADLETACRMADVVVWMGLHTPFALDVFYRLKQKFKKPFVMETDDYCFAIPQANAASRVYAPGSIFSTVAAAQMKVSDAVVVSTPYLKSLYDPFNRHIYVVENAVDLALWRRRSFSPASQRVTLGWVGGASHGEDLELVKGAIYEVLDKYPQARFVCLHGFLPEFEKHPRILCPRDEKGERDFRSIRDYPRWVSSYKFDIGLAPLVDNNFNRGKSNLRYLEYSAQGIPTVASPLPHFVQSIEHGKTGFLASTHTEWVQYLSRLIESGSLRRTMGASALREVRREWSPKLKAAAYLKALKEIVHAPNDTVRAGDTDRIAGRRSEQPAVFSGR